MRVNGAWHPNERMLMETHDVEIASAVKISTAEPIPGMGHITRTSFGTQTSANAVIGATIERIRSQLGAPTAEELAALDGERVTLMCAGSNMLGARAVFARPGTLVNGGAAIIPKGRRTRGYRINAPELLAVTRGYDHTPLAEIYERYSLGAAADVDTSVFAKLPNRGNTCSVAVVATLGVDGRSVPGCLWLCHSYIADEDIVEGMLVVPETSGLVSEYGSVFGKDLASRTAAVLTDALPVPFADAINFDDPEVAYAAIGL